MFVRLVGKHQVGNLLLAALKGTFMQRLSADFELATCVARMVNLSASYKWQMGNGIFCFWSVVPDVKCSLFPDWRFVNCAAKPFYFHAAAGAGERSWATWHPYAFWTATHSTTFLEPTGLLKSQAMLTRSRRTLVSSAFLWEWMQRWHLARCAYEIVNAQMDLEILKE